MKRRFTKLIAALALLLFVAPPMVGWGQTRTETVVYTLDGTTTGGSNGYATESDITQNDIAWKVKANTMVNPWRFGGNSITNEDRPAYTTTALTNNNTNITKVVITTGTATATVNSVKLIVADNSSFTSATTLTESWVASSTITFNRPTGADWTDKFFKIVINVSVSGSSNKYAQFVKAEFYAETGTPQPTTYTVTYNGNGNTSGDVPVDDTEYDDDNNIVTVLGPGDLAKTGHTFEWWSDMQDGTDEDAHLYEEDGTFVITENTTLYAQWSVNTYNYTLNVTGDDGEAMAELQVDGSTVAQDAKIAYDKEVTVVVATNTGYNYSIEVKDADNNDIPVANDKFTMPASDVTVSVTTTLIPTYTITFDAGSGTCNTPTMSDLEGSTINLPTATPSQACVSRGWTFAGWATESVNETTTVPTLLNGDYTIIGNATLYAVYKVTEGNGGTETFNFETIATNNSWNNATVYNPVTQGAVTLTGNKGTSSTNCPIYYSTDHSWRMYNGSNLTVSSSAGDVTAVTSTPSQTFTINNNGTATISFSATVKFTEITVTYGTSTTTYNSNPSCLPMVATPTFTPAAGTYTGAQNVTIECDTDGATIQYKTTEEGEWQNYSEAIPVSTTTTIWAKATNNGMDDSEVAEATYVIQYTLTVNIDDMVEYFLFDNSNETWDEITLDENGQALVSSGADIRISGGEVYDDCYEVESFNVTDGNDDPVTVVDNTDEDGTYSFIMPASNATLTATLNEIAAHYTLTVEGTANVSFEMLVGSMSTITPLNANHQASICEASEVKISELTVGIGYVLESVTINDGNTTTEITPTSGVYMFEMPSSNATLTFTLGEIPTYTYTLATTIESGKSYIIVGQDNGNYFAMGQQNSNNRAAVGISVDVNNKATVASEEVYEFAIESVGENVYSIYDARNNNNEGGYLYAASSSNNYLKTEAELDANGKWAISIGEGGVASVVAQGTYTRKYMRFNINSNNNNPLFSCYASTSDLPKVYLYEKDGTPATESYTLTIDGYTDVTEGTNNRGYYLIASPVTVDLTNHDMTTGDFDLYYFDQAKEDEWRNYEVTPFNLVPGTGYLYAKKATAATPTYNFTLAGAPYSGNGQVTLHKTEGTQYSGWNLIGNPWDVDATIEASREYYKMNTNGNELEPGTDHIVNAMEGIFVIANGYNDEVTFTPSNPDLANTDAMVVMNVTRNRGNVIDRAIVRFGEGGMLPKFQLNPKHTKVYFQQDNKDYAVVRSANEGEMPVNFKAENNGTYTLSVNTENVEMTYLHLIDNKTGADVDLLQTPSYTFEAKTTDYASRFRLVFSANSVASEGACEPGFAYFNGSNWTVSNPSTGSGSEATLQVVDVMGRVLSSETLSGNAEVNINQPTGVYMLRLVSGDSVKVQKVVVR